MVAVGHLLQAGAHRLAARLGPKHLLHEIGHLILGKGYKSRGAPGIPVAGAGLCVVVIPNAVGPAACVLRNALKDLFQRQPLLLRLVRGFPKQIGLLLTPARPFVVARLHLLHVVSPPKDFLMVQSMRVNPSQYTITKLNF